jgi:hypothetical protein
MVRSYPCAGCKNPVRTDVEKCPNCGNQFADAPCPKCDRPLRRLIEMSDEWCEKCIEAENARQDNLAEERTVYADRFQFALMALILSLAAAYWLYPAPFRKAWRWVLSFFS